MGTADADLRVLRTIAVPEALLEPLPALDFGDVCPENRRSELRRIAGSGFGPLPNVLFVGDTGSGKTYAAVALLRQWLPRLIQMRERRAPEGMPAYWRPVLCPVVCAHWWNVPDVLAEAKTMMQEPRGYSRLERALKGEGLVVLDDLGAERDTPWAAEFIYNLLSHRFDHGKPTLLTTNFTLAEFNARDPRLASRLGGNAYKRLLFGGADRRLAPVPAPAAAARVPEVHWRLRGAVR